MFPYSVEEFVLIIASSLAVLGVISILTGIFLLVYRASGKAVHTIAHQTARLAQKGLADEVAGLVGNASSLVDALNQLVRTTAGIGLFLVVFGFVMLLAAYFMTRAFLPYSF